MVQIRRLGALAIALVATTACTLIAISTPCPQGVICFGTDIDSKTGQLSGQTNTFRVGQPIAAVTVVGAMGPGQVLVSVQWARLEPDGSETVEYEETGRPRPLPQNNMIGGKGDVSVFLSGPGTYVERITVAPYVQGGPLASPYVVASGQLQLVAASTAAP